MGQDGYFRVSDVTRVDFQETTHQTRLVDESVT